MATDISQVSAATFVADDTKKILFSVVVKDPFVQWEQMDKELFLKNGLSAYPDRAFMAHYARTNELNVRALKVPYGQNIVDGPVEKLTDAVKLDAAWEGWTVANQLEKAAGTDNRLEAWAQLEDYYTQDQIAEHFAYSEKSATTADSYVPRFATKDRTALNNWLAAKADTVNTAQLGEFFAPLDNHYTTAQLDARFALEADRATAATTQTATKASIATEQTHVTTIAGAQISWCIFFICW